MTNQPSRPWKLRVRRRVWRRGVGGWTRWSTHATYSTEERAMEAMQSLGGSDWRAYIVDRDTGRTKPEGFSERATDEREERATR